MNCARFACAPTEREHGLGLPARAGWLACLWTWLVIPALAGPLSADGEPAREPPAVDGAIRRAMQDRDYAAAIEAIRAASQAEGAPRDYLKYLEGRALQLAGRHEEAVAAFGQLQTEFSKSRWSRRARFAAALTKARQGDFRGAEEIYRAEAEYLLGDERKAQIAKIYLELADAFFQPAEEDEPPDYTKALEGYQRALDAGLTGEKRIEVELRIAQCHQKLKKLDEAIAEYTRLVADHPDAPEALEAAYRLGQCHVEKGAGGEARRVWQDLLAEYHDSPSPRIADALFHLAETWHFPKPENDHQLAAGAASLEEFLKRFPSHPQAGRAFLDLANGYFHRGHQDEAIEVLRRFLEDKQYAEREEVPEALVLLGRSYQVQDRLTEALTTWRRYLTEHPAHEDWGVVQRAVMATEYLMAEEAFRAEQYDRARQLWSEFLAKYPLDPRNPRIRLRFGTMYHREKKWAEALAQWRRAVSKYPDSPEAAEAQLAIAKTLEQDLGRFEEALEAYRQVPAGEHYNQAQQAIARLTAKSLVVAVDRVFRSDETPQIRVISRNLPEVICRLYPIDLETYFRKMHRADGIERLDIALIDPDKSFEFTVPDYRPYEERENLIDIPVEDPKRPGAMAVTVAGPTMEATALVLQSDVDLVMKSSREEVFVFAENMRTMKPWPGVRVLLSDGTRIFAEGSTDQDGVFRMASAELQAAGQLRVFAIADGHVASTALGLEGINVAQGLTDKGYLYTDRPVYRPGQQVQVRGCLRRAVEDAYRIEEGKSYTLEVLDSRNRLLWQQQVALNAFGSFNAHFPVPSTGAPGDYRVLVRDETGRSYQGQFRVHDYPIQPVRLQIESARSVYYRGETIEGTIRAAYDYGTPLAGKEIRYRLAGGRTHTAKTDADGLVHFALATRDFSQSQVLPLVATLAERNLEVTRNFFLATQGFGIDVSSPRSVYLAGESFEVTARAYDAEGKPASRKLTLRLLKRTTVEGKVGQREVQSHPLETSAEEGIARKTLQVDEGGSYLVRVEGTDRFGRAVWGTLPLEISDADDEVRLRILADRHTYHVGDTAQVTLHWREDPALALVTFQGARILHYRLVPLKNGPNELPVSFGADLAPNFELAVAVMTDAPPAEPGRKPPRRFHEASSPFTVQRQLKVTLAAKKKGEAAGPLRPGDPVEVTLTTTDPQGRPVAAELSLAMLQTTLLERFSWPIDPIHAFFRGAPREPAFRTTASITFASRPDTHPINARLLAEAERQEIARQEAARLQGGFGGGAFGGAGGFGGGAFGPPAPPPTGTLPIERGETAGDLVAGVTGQSEPTGGPKPDQPTAETDIGDFSKLVELVRSAPQAATESTRAEPLDRRLSIVVSQTEELPGAAAPGPEPAPAGGLSIDQTAYWNPAIVTGQDGRATVTITLPPQSTAWTLVAKGITADTLAGEATEQLVVRQEFFAQLKLPQAFTEGDQAEVIALVHNEAVEAGQIQVTLRTTIGMRSVEQTKTIEVQAPGEHEVAFTVDLSSPDTQPAESKGRPEEVQFELTVQAGDHQHTVHRAVPLLPYGAPVYATSGGTASGDTTTWVEMPAGLPVRGPRLTIFVAPTVERSLLDVVLAPRRIALGGCLLWELYSEIESAGSDLMAALGLEQLVGATPAAGGPVVVALDRRIRSAIARLIASQNQRGGWSWTGRGAATDGPTTARLVWALSLARSAGYPVPEKNYQQAISWIKKQMARTADTDRRSKAILLHALATAGEGDFSVANRLHRERTQLGPKAALYLALAFAAMDREATARELLERVRAPAQADSATRAADDWDAETWALYALALQQLTPQAPQTKSSVQWLLAHRVGPRWEPDRATGPATLALCRWFAGRRVETQRYQIAVFVNDVQAAVLQIDGRSGTQEIAVPARLLHEGRQRINFQLTGRGRYTYQCLLGGFVPAEQLKTTIAGCQVRRTYQPAPLEVDGKEIPRGFRIATGRYTRFQNRLTQLPVGRRAIVRLSVRCPDNEGGPASPFDYLVVTEPIPAGTAVVESSITGSFERYEISPGAITFFLGRARPETTIQYEVHGYLPGKYRARPAIVRNAHRPDQMAVGPAKTLTVLPAGATSSDPYQLTPQELYALGTHYFRQGEFQTAEKHLSELVSRWSLTPPVYKKAVRMLLDIQLQEGSPPEVVRYFEIVKERWPEEKISFDKSLRIAAAYHEIGEYERSYLAYRATVEGRFVRESSLAGFLEDHGRFLQGVHFIQDLLRQYPPEPYVAAATYALAQRIYAKAPEAARDPELRRAKVTRVDLIRRASDMLEDFLTEYPEDPAADQAAFARANTLLELKAYREAAEACRQYADRYPASDLLDTFWYIIGYCQFAMGQHDAALEMCQKVAQASVVDKKTGRKREAKNKWQAIYILGQIYHSLGRAAEAIQQYRLVEDRFADAKKSIEYFLRKQIALPEVTTVRPGQPVRVELTFRNLAACDVRVYRIDLMKFSLLRRDLGAITRINLAGIRPEHQVTVSLGDGVDYRDRTHSLPLPLEEEGAYLIVARGDNLHASGLVLISPLVVEVQYDRKAGQVRATVKDVVANRYVRDVEVKVIGTGNVDFVSGSTDLRGVFVAEGIRGLPTVVARSGASRYAFYRSPGIMPGLPPPPLPAVAQATPRPPTAQAPIQPVPAPGSSRSAVQRRMENQRRIQAALDSPTAFQFQDTPLDDAIDYLQRLHRIEIRLDRRALEAVGLSEDTPITQTASGITLRSALDLILDQLDLDFVIHNEVLLITTPEQLETEEFQTTVVYPVTDLVRFRDEEGKTWSDFQSLIDAIQTTVQPDTWDVVGGPGSIAPMTFGDTDVLVFSQTQKVHEQVAEFLANLRRIAGTSERKEGELPVKERPKPGAESPFGWGGMGGFGGAMGGFGGAMGGGGRGAFGGDPFGISVAPVEGQAPEAGPPPAAGPPDLLKGIQDANRQMQSQQTEQLQKMYQKGSGMGGMGAGGLF